MKALVLEEYNKLVYKDFPDPVLAEDEVLVREIFINQLVVFF